MHESIRLGLPQGADEIPHSPTAERHGTEAELRYEDACVGELSVFHGGSLVLFNVQGAGCSASPVLSPPSDTSGLGNTDWNWFQLPRSAQPRAPDASSGSSPDRRVAPAFAG